MARVRLVKDARGDARVCLPWAIPKTGLCKPRYNKGGAIAVVKSTESLNSWYRSANSLSSLLPLLPPPAFVSCRERFSIPLARALCYPTQNYPKRTGPFSLSSRAPGGLGDYVTCTFACACLFWPAIWSASVSLPLSLSRSPERESIMLNPAGSNETRQYARILAE